MFKCCYWFAKTFDYNFSNSSFFTFLFLCLCETYEVGEKVLVEYGELQYPAFIDEVIHGSSKLKIRWCNDDPEDTWKNLNDIQKIKVMLFMNPSVPVP